MTLEEQKQLTERLDKASRLYYNGKESEFSDTEFDIKLHELEGVEKENKYVFPFSPTLRVGSDIQSGFEKGEHPKYMLTISNTYDDDGLKKWVNGIKTSYSNSSFNVSVKYDGISCELHYYDGVLVKALTRGDKAIGDDITANVRTIKGVPLRIDRANSGWFYVRGEVLLPRTMLYYVNAEREANGEPKLSNTRNACSGSIKQLDPKVTAKRNLIFRAWDCFFTDERENKWGPSMTRKFPFLQELGFKYESGTMPFRTTGSTEDIVRKVNDFKSMLNLRSDIDFDFDGVVVKIDEIQIQNAIGTKDTRSIEWGIARKWNEEYSTSTELIDVEWSVGRTGNVTPVARLKPVELDGVVISNATLNNEDYINKLDLHIGDTVSIVRSGGVIPNVVGNLTLLSENYANRGEKVKFPKVCPSCGAPLKKDGANHFCTNKECMVQKLRFLEYWCSKDAMDIRGIGESVVKDLSDSGLCSDVFSLYGLIKLDTQEIIDRLGEGYGEKSINKIIQSLKDSKNRSFDVVITSLGIDGVGKVIARSLATRFETFQNLMNASVEELLNIDGIGFVVAKNVWAWMQENGSNWLKFLLDEGFNVESAKVFKNALKLANTALNGLTLVFTGKSKYFSGDDVEKFLENSGATIGTSVNKKLSYLIIGEKPGPSKVSKAEGFGIPIIDEDTFYQKFNINANNN